MVFGPVSGFTQPWWSSRSCVIKLDIIGGTDRKSTRLNSSHDQISYAVFCLKKKKIYQAAHAYRTTTIRNNATCRTDPHTEHRIEQKPTTCSTISRHTKFMIAVGVCISRLAT